MNNGNTFVKPKYIHKIVDFIIKILNDELYNECAGCFATNPWILEKKNGFDIVVGFYNFVCTTNPR